MKDVTLKLMTRVRKANGQTTLERNALPYRIEGANCGERMKHLSTRKQSFRNTVSIDNVFNALVLSFPRIFAVSTR